MLVTDKINLIKQLQENYSDAIIARNLNTTTKELREFRLANKVFYKDEKYNGYLELAIELQKIAPETYFPVEMARLTNTSVSTVSMVSRMFNVKPSKKAYCLHCGKELVVKITAVPSYCNTSCRNRHKGVVKC